MLQTLGCGLSSFRRWMRLQIVRALFAMPQRMGLAILTLFTMKRKDGTDALRRGISHRLWLTRQRVCIKIKLAKSAMRAWVWVQFERALFAVVSCLPWWVRKLGMLYIALQRKAL